MLKISEANKLTLLLSSKIYSIYCNVIPYKLDKNPQEFNSSSVYKMMAPYPVSLNLASNVII